MASLNNPAGTGVFGCINGVFDNFIGKIDGYGVEIAKAMAELDKEAIDQADLIEIQFAMGQYNAMLETASTVTKKITDVMSTLAQRSA